MCTGKKLQSLRTGRRYCIVIISIFIFHYWGEKAFETKADFRETNFRFWGAVFAEINAPVA